MASTLIEPSLDTAPGSTELSGTARLDPVELDRRAKAQTSVRWELLEGMVRRDLKLKYQSSALGFVWSLINPLFYLVVYGLIFGVLLHNGVPEFPIYLMAGLLVWNVFAGGVSGGAASVVGSAGLVRKVRFPLAVLPMAQVGFALVHYVLQMGVFLAVVIIWDIYSGNNSFGLHTLLFAPGLVLVLTFTIGMSFLCAALNVRYRDTTHLLELLLFAWFWAASIIYASGLITQSGRSHPGAPTTYVQRAWWVGRTFFADPMATGVAFMHRAFASNVHATTGTVANPGQAVLPASSYAWYAEQWFICMAISCAVLYFSKRLFDNWSKNFAEEL